MNRDLNEAELLSIKRLNQKGVDIKEIADRMGVSAKRVENIIKFKSKP